MALVETAGAPYIGSSTSASVTFASFTPTANNLIVAIVGFGNGNGITPTSLTISDTFTGTANGSWFLLAQELEASGGAAGIWCKDAGSAPGSGVVTVVVSPSTVLDGGGIVRQFAGALPAAFQVAGVGNGVGGTIDSITITPTFTGSQLVGSYGAPVNGVVVYNANTTGYGTTAGTHGDSFGAFEATSLSTAGTSASIGFNTAKATTGLCAAEVMPSNANVLAIVGSPGSVAVSAVGSGASPGWGTGSSRVSGDLLVALVAGAEITGATAPVPSGWTIGASVTAASTSMALYWKIAAGGDAAPVFTGHAANVQSAMLMEFAPSNSTTIAATPTDQSGTHTTTTTSTPNAVAAGSTDTGTNAELVIGGTSISYSAAAVKTLTNTPGEAMVFTNVSNAGASTRAHYSFYWGHTNSNGSADSNSLALTGTAGQGSSQIIQSFLLPSSGGSVHTSSISASIIPIASFVKETFYPVSAALNFTGSFVRFTSALLTATSNFVGTYTRLTSALLVSAVLSFVGTFVRNVNALLSGTLNFAGTFVRRTSALLSGTLTPVGTFVRRLTRTLTTAVQNFTGTLTSTRLLQALLNAIFGFKTNDYDSLLQSLSPQAYWKLADPVGASIGIIDSSGNGHAGSVNGTVTFGNQPIPTFAPETTALPDGNTGYITTSLTAPSGAFSLAVWAYLVSPQGSFPDQFPYIIACTSNSNNSGVALGVGYQGSFGAINNTFFFVGDGSAQHEIDWFGAQLVPNTWAFLVGTYDGSSTINFYANGIPINFAACPAIGAGMNWSIAANNGFGTGYNDFYPGGIGHAAIFNYQLSLTQIQNLYEAAEFGTLFKQTQIPTGGSMGSAGTFTRATSALLSGVANFAGTLTKRTNRALSGVLNFVGSLTTGSVLTQALSAALNFTGTVVKQTNRTLAGTLSFATSTTRQVVAQLSGTLNFVGTYASKAVKHTFTSRLSANTFRYDIGGQLHPIWPAYDPTAPDPGGSWQLAAANPPTNPPGYIIVSIGVDGGPGSSADPNWQTNITNATAAGWTVLGYVNTSNSGTIVATSTVKSEIDQWYSFYTGIGGVFFDQVLGDTGSGTTYLTQYQAFHDYVKTQHSPQSWVVFNVGATANSSFVATSICDVICTYENIEADFNVAGYPPGGITGTGICYILEACASTTSLAADIVAAKSLGATYFWATDQAVYTSPPSTPFFNALEADTTTTGTLFKKTARLLGGVLNFAASLASTSVLTQALSATLNFAATTTRQVGKNLVATATPMGTFIRKTFALLSGTLQPVGTFVRNITYPLTTAVLSFTGSISRAFPVVLTAVMNFTGTVAKQTGKAFAPALNFTGTFVRKTNALLQAAAAPQGTLTKSTRRTLVQSVLSFVGSILGQIIGATVPGSVSITNVPNACAISSATAAVGIVNTTSTATITQTQSAVAISDFPAACSIETEVLT